MLRYILGSVWLLRQCKGKEKENENHALGLIIFAVLVSNLEV
jgi:hypothetical protein